MHRKISVESHRSNGRIERSIGTLREYIAKMGTTNNQKDIGECIEAYNNTYHIYIERTPNEALNKSTGYDLQRLNKENSKMKEKKHKNMQIKEGDIV